MITAIIQARMGSPRLPGKVLLPLGDTSVLGHTVRQVKKATAIAKVVIATSNDAADEVIAAQGKELGVEVLRGSLTDVLDRYYQTAKTVGAQDIARITADCPLIDPVLIDRVAAEYATGKYDYLSTGRIITTFPDGMDTEIFSMEALERAWREAKLPSEHEHVTPYIWNHPELFRVGEYKSPEDLSAIRLTLDERQDYRLIQNIVANVPQLSMESIVEYVRKHPEVAALNAGIVHEAGYAESLKNDEKKKN